MNFSWTSFSWAKQLFLLSTDPRVWIIQVFFVVFTTATVNFFLTRIWDIAREKSGRQKYFFTSVLLNAARLPLQIFIWLWGISFALWVIGRVADWPLLEYAPGAARIVFAVIVTLFCVRFISGMEEYLVDPEKVERPLDLTTANAISNLLSTSVYVTMALVVLQTMGYSISGVLAFGGIGGLAVGFAAKDVLANFLAALMLFIDKPFKVGDWIRSPDREIEGTVLEIGWRSTHIRTFDSRALYVPNSVFSTISIENPSRMLGWRIQERWELRFDDWQTGPDCVNAVRKMLEQHEELTPSRAPLVNFDNITSSGLSLWIYIFTKTTDWEKYLKIREDILLKIVRIVHEHGAEIALPVQKIEFPMDETPALPQQTG